VNWFRVLVDPNSTFILNVIWDASVLVGQLLALHEDSAVSWMTKESYISLWLGEVLCHLQRFQTSDASSGSNLVPTKVRAAG